jgi:hypothetical protein
MRITVDTRAAERMLQRAPVAINRALEAAMNDAQTDIHAQMQTYPPKRRGSTYDRTNTLRGSWQKPRPTWRGGTITAIVASSGMAAPYNILVQKADTQARVHRGVWRNTDRVVMERSRQRVERYFSQRIGSAIASLNR